MYEKWHFGTKKSEKIIFFITPSPGGLLPPNPRLCNHQNFCVPAHFLYTPRFLRYAGRMYVERFERVTHNPAVMGGKPCIRGMRVTVAMVVNQIGAGHSIEEILASYPYLEREDVLQALQYAAWRVEEREIALETA